MNCFSAISVMRRMVGGVIGSRCRLNIPALSVAGVVKLTAAAPLDEVSVTRWPAGGSGMLAGKQTRIMSTTGGGATDHDNGQKEVVKTTEDVGAEDISNDSWESFREKLVNFPKWRSDEEIRTIYKRWCDTNDYEGKSGVFKEKMRLIDEFNAKYPDAKVGLNFNCETSSEHVVKSFIKYCQRPIRPKRYRKRSRKGRI